MKIDIQMNEFSIGEPVRVGNVYPVKGGRGVREKHLQVLIAMSEDRRESYFLVVNKDGEAVGVNRYGTHYVNDLQPIAFVEGLEDLVLVMRSL